MVGGRIDLELSIWKKKKNVYDWFQYYKKNPTFRSFYVFIGYIFFNQILTMNWTTFNYLVLFNSHIRLTQTG